MSDLTQRQREVVALLAEGLTYREIGTRLAIGPRTVRMHVETIARRLPGRESPKWRVLKCIDRLLAA